MQISLASASPATRDDASNPAIKLCNLPPFSAAAAKIIQLAEAPTTDLQTIQPIVASDPSLAAELLRLANSPLFAFSNEIHSVEHAVVLMGLQQVKMLAVAIAMKSYWTDVDDGAYQQCWSHSVACAVIAEELAGPYNMRKEDAYTAGLLHDIGRLGLLKAYSREYLPILTATHTDVAEALLAEQRALKLDHCQSGLWLTKAWDFPNSLQAVAEHHHTESSPDEVSLTNLIRVACMFADALGYPELHCSQPLAAEDVARCLKDYVAHRFMARIPQVEKRIAEKINYFQM